MSSLVSLVRAGNAAVFSRALAMPDDPSEQGHFKWHFIKTSALPTRMRLHSKRKTAAGIERNSPQGGSGMEAGGDGATGGSLRKRHG